MTSRCTTPASLTANAQTRVCDGAEAKIVCPSRVQSTCQKPEPSGRRKDASPVDQPSKCNKRWKESTPMPAAAKERCRNESAAPERPGFEAAKNGTENSGRPVNYVSQGASQEWGTDENAALPRVQFRAV
jgi:hypothetical protein